MAIQTKSFNDLNPIHNGTSVAENIKLTDVTPVQHTDLGNGVNTINKLSLGQLMCEPVAIAGVLSGNTYSAECSNYPDFSVSYQDNQGNSHYLIGMKVRVIFTSGIAYGSVSAGTYPTLNINGTGAIPLLAQGKTMAAGAASAGQSLEFTLIPYGSGVAWDADSNVREVTADSVIYTDGSSMNRGVMNLRRIMNSSYWGTSGAGKGAYLKFFRQGGYIAYFNQISWLCCPSSSFFIFLLTCYRGDNGIQWAVRPLVGSVTITIESYGDTWVRLTKSYSDPWILSIYELIPNTAVSASVEQT